MRQAAYFIEQFKKEDFVRHSRLTPMRLFQWCMEVNFNHNIETVAIFKVYPHPKPAIAEYDKEVNAIIIE